jgi:hypothetical protein
MRRKYIRLREEKRLRIDAGAQGNCLSNFGSSAGSDGMRRKSNFRPIETRDPLRVIFDQGCNPQRRFKMKRFAFLSAVVIILCSPLWSAAQGLGDYVLPEISPEFLNFGPVEIGASKTLTMTVTDPAGYHTVYAWIQTSSNAFQIASSGLPHTFKDAGESFEIEVAFSPSASEVYGSELALLIINQGNIYVYIDLYGKGVASAPDPLEEVQTMLDFFDECVAGGLLTGQGFGSSAAGRLMALRNMIEAAADLLLKGYPAAALRQLLDAYHRCDGVYPPPDFVSGPAAADLAAMIWELMGLIST